MQIRKSTFAEDENGDGVALVPGDTISEITDAGPNHVEPLMVTGWNVSFRCSPKHKLWSEILTCDAVKLLKSFEG